MKKRRINYTGNFWEYLFINMLVLLLVIITGGLALPYYIYWSLRYFFTRLEIED